jgi:hypothetical protein
VVQSDLDARAIVYDAGLVANSPDWKNIAWMDTKGNFQGTDITASSGFMLKS